MVFLSSQPHRIRVGAVSEIIIQTQRKSSEANDGYVWASRMQCNEC